MRGKFIALAVVVALAAGIAAVSAPSARAAAPCWRAVFDDWYDGQVDRTYDIVCYRDALRHLPDDVRAYSSAEDDIARAMLVALRARRTTDDDRTSGVLGVQAKAGAQPDRALQGSTASVPSSDGPTSPPLPLVLAAGFASLLLAVGLSGKYRMWRKARLARAVGGEREGAA